MSNNDVEMKDVEDKNNNNNNEENKEEDKSKIILNDLVSNIKLCEKTSTTKEMRFVTRVLRKIVVTRKKLNDNILKEVIKLYFPNGNEDGMELINILNSLSDEENEDVDMLSNDIEGEDETIEKILPEVHVYINLLVVIYLIDNKHYELACGCSSMLIDRMKLTDFNRRTLDPLVANVYFYHSRAHELTNRLSSIRPQLLAAYRTATLRHDQTTQAVLLNLLLRNYLQYNLYNQADKLVSKTKMSEDVNSNQFARYLYYTGKIAAVQLDYSNAFQSLQKAFRKAPQNSARGFRITVQKLSCIVQLLMGEIPEKAIFHQKDYSVPLRPYFDLTMAVRIGDLAAFQTVVKENEAVFQKDKNFTLIQRLRKNVIKTGLRKINLSYSRISLVDVCAKLHLESEKDAAFIVAKAIRDGVIDATIDYQGQYLKSNETIDIYSTSEPQEAFHKRIVFCLNTHNDAVKAMRFPPAEHNQKEDKERKEILAQNEEDIVSELEEEDEEDDL